MYRMLALELKITYGAKPSLRRSIYFLKRLETDQQQFGEPCTQLMANTPILREDRIQSSMLNVERSKSRRSFGTLPRAS